MNKNFLISLLIIIAVAGLGYAVVSTNNSEFSKEPPVIDSPEVTEPTPGNVEVPVEKPSPSVPKETSKNTGPCYIGGCSGQICSDEEGVASTCEYREEYACYKNSKCERQANGQCGWTQNSALISCLSAAGNASIQ